MTQSPAPASQPRRFNFDTVFDGDRVIAPIKPKRVFTAEEVEAARAQGLAEGRQSSEAKAQAAAAAALADATAAIRQAMGALAGVAQEHKAGGARLALACARRIADAALDQFPEQPAMAALDALSRELEAYPRLVVRTTSADADRLQTALAAAADAAGYAGQVLVRVDPGLPRAGFSFDWGEGRAAFDPEAAAERIGAVLEEALAAEGLHAEPLLTLSEA